MLFDSAKLAVVLALCAVSIPAAAQTMSTPAPAEAAPATNAGKALVKARATLVKAAPDAAGHRNAALRHIDTAIREAQSVAGESDEPEVRSPDASRADEALLTYGMLMVAKEQLARAKRDSEGHKEKALRATRDAASEVWLLAFAAASARVGR